MSWFNALLSLGESEMAPPENLAEIAIGITIDTESSDPVVDRVGKLNLINNNNNNGAIQAQIYGVVIDEQNKKYAYLNDDDFSKFADNTPVGYYGNAFVHFPRIYYYAEENENYYTLWISLERISNRYWEEKYIAVYDAAYEGFGDKFISRSGRGPLTDMDEYGDESMNSLSSKATLKTVESHAKLNGSNYGIADYDDYKKLCALLLAIFPSRRCSSGTLNWGGNSVPAYLRSVPECTFTGKGNSLGKWTGFVPDLSGKAVANKLFGIENIVNESGTIFNFTKPRYDFGSDYNIHKMVLGKEFDLIPYDFGYDWDAIYDVSASSTTYWCAPWQSNNSEPLPIFGYKTLFGQGTGGLGLWSAIKITFEGSLSGYTLVTGSQLNALNS